MYNLIRCVAASVPLHMLMMLLATLITLSGCAKNTPKAIIGTWRLSQTHETMEFREDGTLLQTDTSGNVSTWNYTFIDDARIKIHDETDTGRETIIEVDIRFNQMMVTELSPDAGVSRSGLYERIRGT